MPVSQFFLIVIACAQSSAVAQDPSCAEPRVQLETAIALVSSLEHQLEEAKQRVVASELQVRWCTLGVNTTPPQRHSEAIFRSNGQGDSSDVGKSAHDFPHMFAARMPRLPDHLHSGGAVCACSLPLYDGKMHMATTSLSVAPASLQRFLLMRSLRRR